MDTSLYPDTDKIRPADDHVSAGDPWALGHSNRVVLPPEYRGNGRRVWLLVGALLLAVAGSGAIFFALLQLRSEPAPEEQKEEPPRSDKDAPGEKKDEAPLKRTEIRKNLFLEVQGDRRRVVVNAEVCLREGQLEGLLCRKNTKEHEYIVATDVDARDIHTALLAAKATPGTPVQFAPKYVPASGSVISVSLRYQKDGKLVTVRAQDWIQDVKAAKAMEQEWVFGGSRFIVDPDDPKRPIYLANGGDVICVCNMESAMLDLAVRSPKSPENRIYHAFTARIPPKDTKVEVILEVVPEKK